MQMLLSQHVRTQSTLKHFLNLLHLTTLLNICEGKILDFTLVSTSTLQDEKSSKLPEQHNTGNKHKMQNPQNNREYPQMKSKVWWFWMG